MRITTFMKKFFFKMINYKLFRNRFSQLPELNFKLDLLTSKK